MQKRIGSIWTWVILLLVSSCSTEETNGDGTRMVDLEFTVSQPAKAVLPDGDTRAPYALPAGDHEKMHSLRIIIVRESGTVEYNDFHRLEGYHTTRVYRYRVYGGESKRIYLLANEQSRGDSGRPLIDHDFGTMVPGSLFPDAETVSLTMGTATGEIGADRENPLPMSAFHRFEMPQEDMQKELWIIRSAVKVSFLIRNTGSTAAVIDSLAFTPVATEAYCFLHRNADELSANLTGPEWTVPEFQVPATATAAYTVRAPGLEIQPGQEVAAPPFYILESKVSPPFSGSPYRAVLVVDGRRYERALPDTGYPDGIVRNTHLIIKAEIRDKTCRLQVDLIPYWNCLLEPAFGT